MVINYVRIAVDKEDFDLFMNDCKEMFLRHNPEFDGMNITQRFLFKRMVKVYLKKI